MSGVALSVSNVLIVLQHIKDQLPPSQWETTQMPVIAAPSWWITEVIKLSGVEGADQLDEVHGCKVVPKQDIAEPMMVDHAGRVYTILPEWMRAAGQAVAAEAVKH